MAAATNTKQQQPAPKPEFANGEKSKAVVDQENLEAGVIRRIEEEKAKAAAAAMEAKAVLEKKATASSGWKERVAGGLEQLTDMKWADSVVEKARNNKEVVAIAIAAFSLGFFVSHKLFRNVTFSTGLARTGANVPPRGTSQARAGVLTLTVPKRPYSGVPAPTSVVEEIKRDKPGVVKEDGAAATTVRPPPTKDVAGSEKKAASGDDSTTKPKEEIAKEEDVSKKAMDEATKNAQHQKQPEEASNHKQEQQKLAPEPEAKKEREVKPEAPQAAAPAAPEKPAPEPEVAIGEKNKAVVDQESLAAGVIRRSEEEKAKAAAAMEAKAVLEKKATACSGWKERVAGGLEQLTDMKWAESVVEKARNNKEVVAIAVAAFSLGFFVSHKLFRK
uniref:Uncharacterized protein n=1 Tax=Aegilops tauschii TaxID=37682 RepID=M8BKD9_AEGTA